MILTPVLGAQRNPEIRRSHVAFASYSDGPATGRLRTTNDSDQATRHYAWFDGSPALIVDSGLEAFGSLQWLHTSGSKTFLASGAASLGTGQSPLESRLSIVQLLDAPSRNIVTLQSHTYPGLDLLASTWDATTGVLYIADGASKQVRWAPWAGVGVPFPQTFATAFTDVDVPLLATAPGVALVPIAGGVRATNTATLIGCDAIWSGSSWTFTPHDPRLSGIAQYWHVQSALSCPTVGTLSLKAVGPTGIVNYTCVPMLDSAPEVFSGSHPGTGVIGVNCPTVFHEFPGRPYSIQGAPLRAQLVIPVVTYGSPVTTPHLGIDGNLGLPSLQFFVGVTQLFGPGCPLKLFAANPSGTTRQAYLLIGVRDSNGVDPVVSIGSSGGYSLDPATIVPFNVDFPANRTERIARRRMDVPNEPLLENVVVLFQIAVEDGAGGLAYTSVRGTSVLPSWVDPRTTPEQRGLAGGEAFSTKEHYRAHLLAQLQRSRAPEALRAARAWTGLEEDGRTPAGQRDLLRRLHARMR